MPTPRRSSAFVLLLITLASAAGAHAPRSSDPFVQQGCTAGLSELGSSWAVLGALLSPTQVDYICFDVSPGDMIRAQIVIPPQAA